MAQDREQYKERMRAAGRRALEEFRRHKGERAAALTGGSSGAGAAAVASPAPSPPPPAVELATFRVYTRPAAVDTGLVRPPESSELRLLAPALASTSLGPLPPGSACLAPLPPPPSSSPSAAASTIGTTSVGSLGSTATGFSAAPFVGAAGGSAAASPPASHVAAAAVEEEEEEEEEDMRLQGFSPGRSGGGGGGGVSGGGGGDSAMVDMLLGQVAALMRDKAALSAENAALRQQVEQLTELVGWLSLERGEPEGGGLEAGGLEGLPEAEEAAEPEALYAAAGVESEAGHSGRRGDEPGAGAEGPQALCSGGSCGEGEGAWGQGELDLPVVLEAEARISGVASVGRPPAAAAGGPEPRGGAEAATDGGNSQVEEWQPVGTGGLSSGPGSDPLGVVAGLEGGAEGQRGRVPVVEGLSSVAGVSGAIVSGSAGPGD